jgi:hypothetical protein
MLETRHKVWICYLTINSYNTILHILEIPASASNCRFFTTCCLIAASNWEFLLLLLYSAVSVLTSWWLVLSRSKFDIFVRFRTFMCVDMGPPLPLRQEEGLLLLAFACGTCDCLFLSPYSESCDSSMALVWPAQWFSILGPVGTVVFHFWWAVSVDRPLPTFVIHLMSPYNATL